MTERIKGNLGEVIEGLRAVARLNASGDFVRVDSQPLAIQPPYDEGWGRKVRTRLMAAMFIPPIFLALVKQTGMRLPITQLLTVMLCLFLFSTTVPVMFKRIRFLNDHRENSMPEGGRWLMGIALLFACTALGGILSSSMFHALME